MYAIKAIYDGDTFRLLQPIPVKDNYEVVITFTEPLKKDQSSILHFFNTWDGNELDLKEIWKEREKFSLGREI